MNLAPHGTAPRPRRVAMITHSFYESDNRVLRYAETLAARGDEVEVFALRRNPETPVEERINGVRVLRVQNRFAKDAQSGAFDFLWPLVRFLAVSSWHLSRRHLRCRYRVVHVHNIPDFLVFAAWLPRFTGAKVILDIHDIVPEFFGSKFKVSNRSLLVRGLRLVEKLSAAFAHHVILANHLWLETYTSRSARPEKCSVFINHVDERVFYPRERTRADGIPLVMFPGGLQWHQGLDIAVRAMALLRGRLPNAEFHIYGDGNMKPKLVELAQELGLTNCVRFFNPLRIQEIAGVMAQADLGVVPKRADSFGNEAYSTKIMEFMSLGVPMVVSSTKIDRYYFDDTVVRFFESGNVEALAEAMHEALTRTELRRGMVERALQYVAQNSWQSRKEDYLRLVDTLGRRKQPNSLPAVAGVSRS